MLCDHVNHLCMMPWVISYHIIMKFIGSFMHAFIHGRTVETESRIYRFSSESRAQ